MLLLGGVCFGALSLQLSQESSWRLTLSVLVALALLVVLVVFVVLVVLALLVVLVVFVVLVALALLVVLVVFAV